MSETKSGLRGSLHYNPDLFDDQTMIRMLGHLQVLLEGIISDPDRRLADLPMLTQTEKHQLLVEWNDTGRDYPKDKCIHELFEEQVERTPDAVAVVYEEQQLTYRELNTRANQLAHYLRKFGVGPETLVGICVERSLETVVGLLGILKAGGAYVPLDPDYPSQRLSFMIEDSEIVILLTQKRLVSKLPQHGARVVCVDGEPEINAKVLRENPTALVKPESLAYVIYTSGSTGNPKGVQVPHRTVVNFFESMRREFLLTDKDVMLSVTTISFDIAGLELYLPLTIGARVVLVSREVALDGKRLVASLENVQATVMQATPSTWKLMLLSGWQGSRRLKILSGGEALSPELAEALRKAGGSVWNLYGPTETTIWSTAWRVKPGSGPMSIGRPIANTQVYVLDRNLQVVPIGVPGELHIGGDGVARGYLKRPELTAEKFIPDPLSAKPEARLYKTGDLARYLTDGDIEFLGRIDNQVKIRGFRIELGEIEAVLNQHSSIARAVVVDREISGDRRLVAYVMPKNGETPKHSDLKTFLQTKLPEYMVPAGFAKLEALPLTPNGKVDRKALPAADGIRSDTEYGFVAPRDSVELELAKIWGRILGTPSVGVKDDFFDLGGHSLLAVRLFAQIEKSFGRKFPLATLFQAPTIEQLAVLLREKEWSPSWSSLVAIQPNGSKPPFFCVHAHGGNVLIFKALARRLGMDQPFYGLQARGLDGAEPRHTNIEEMARDYITEIRTLQPQGPYLIGGYCFGGKIAFEMAQQLRVQGQAVLLLALIDSYAPGHPKMLPWIRRRRVQIEFHCNNLAKAEPEERLAYFKKRGKNATAKMDAFAKKLLVEGCHGLRIRPPAALHSVAESNGRSRKSYHPTPYSGTIKVFSPTEGSSAYCHHVPDMGWKDFAAGGIDVYPIFGKFATIILEPRVKRLAEQLQSCIDAALRDERRRGSGKRYVEHLEHADPSLHPLQ
jgi:amino acid adenylation domain-containing protein